jgi:hypothetical protein
MLPSPMPREVALPHECLWAEITREWAVVRVPSSVEVEVAGSGKRFGAVRALQHLVTTVCLEMIVIIILSKERA